MTFPRPGFFRALLLTSLPFGLLACGEAPGEAPPAIPSKPPVSLVDTIRTEYAALSVEKLQAESVRLRGECRQSQEDSTQPDSNCNRLSMTEEILTSQGWCWGPYGAASPDKSWMPCADDVTQVAEQKGPWYASTKGGTCRVTSLGEAISKVLEHGGPWNVKTSISPDGFFDVSSRITSGGSYNVRLFPSCVAALLVYIPDPVNHSGLSMAVPLGMGIRDAGEYFGFDARASCSGYSFGRGLGCTFGQRDGMPAPIQMSDGFTPCTEGKPIQFDFQPDTGLKGMTCSVSAEKLAAFNQRMTSAFGAGEQRDDGALRWKFGSYAVRSLEAALNKDTVMRRVSVYQE